MSELSKRTTVHFDPSVYEALKTKAEYAQLSISALIDDAVRLLLSEYREDLSAFLEREKEPEIDYEALLNDLKSLGNVSP